MYIGNVEKYYKLGLVKQITYVGDNPVNQMYVGKRSSRTWPFLTAR